MTTPTTDSQAFINYSTLGGFYEHVELVTLLNSDLTYKTAKWTAWAEGEAGYKTRLLGLTSDQRRELKLKASCDALIADLSISEAVQRKATNA